MAADSIRRGLNEAVAYAKGQAAGKAYRVHVPQAIDVKAIRAKLHMSNSTMNPPAISRRPSKIAASPTAG